MPPEMKRQDRNIGYGGAPGCPQSEITITYRFSQPKEPAALILPRGQSCSQHAEPTREAGDDR